MGRARVVSLRQFLRELVRVEWLAESCFARGREAAGAGRVAVPTNSLSPAFVGVLARQGSRMVESSVVRVGLRAQEGQDERVVE